MGRKKEKMSRGFRNSFPWEIALNEAGLNYKVFPSFVEGDKALRDFGFIPATEAGYVIEEGFEHLNEYIKLSCPEMGVLSLVKRDKQYRIECWAASFGYSEEQDAVQEYLENNPVTYQPVNDIY